MGSSEIGPKPSEQSAVHTFHQIARDVRQAEKSQGVQRDTMMQKAADEAAELFNEQGGKGLTEIGPRLQIVQKTEPRVGDNISWVLAKGSGILPKDMREAINDKSA